MALTEAAAAAAGIEIARMLLQAYFKAMEVAQQTDEQIKTTFAEEQAKFEARDPSKLPDP